MSDKHFRFSELEEKLRCLPERTPPANLQKRIMESLPAKPETLMQRTAATIHMFFRNRPQPFFAAVGTVCLLITFYGGTQFEKLRQTTVPNIPTSLAAKGDMSADSTFFLGRSLLAAGNPEKALIAFRQAEMLRPENPEYPLWKAASHYALGDSDSERQDYLKIIARRPDFLPAKLNLAHNLLENGQPRQAELLYREVLQQSPQEKSALYNRGLALHLEKKKTAEKEAWKHYLTYYRTGAKAFRAVKHLHDLDDFTYRRYQLGYRTIILNQEALLLGSGTGRDKEIHYLTTLFARQPEKILDLVVFNQNDSAQAKQTAIQLRSDITVKLSEIDRKKVQISWFGEPETIERENQAATQLPEGILIFSTPGNLQKGERI